MFSSIGKCQKTYFISGTNFNIGNITLNDYHPDKLCETSSNRIHFSGSDSTDELTAFLDPVNKSINVNSLNDNKIIKIEISDLTGKIIVNYNFDNSTSAIVKTDSLSNGIYFLKVYMQDYYKIIKCIIN